MGDLVRVDSAEKGSSGWWLESMGKALQAKQQRLGLLDAYFRGDPPLPSSADTARKAYQQFRKLSRVNFAEMLVEAVRHRMIPLGFRTGADGDENGDKKAREIWQENDLDVESVDVHQNMLGLGVGYVIVGRDEDTGGALITAEDPRQVITVHDPRLRRRVRAGLKVFRDDVEGLDLAYVYLPGQLWVAGKPAQKDGGAVADTLGFQVGDWSWIPDLCKPLGPGFERTVPVVRFLGPRGGTGIFEPHIDHLDRINTMILQRVVVAIMQAFRQRAVKGDLPSHSEDGSPIDYDAVFAAGPDALWQLPEGVDLWESESIDLRPILEAVKEDVQHLAAATFCPMHMFSPDGATGSAEGASLLREGIVWTAQDRIARASIGWRQVMSLAFQMAGDEQRAKLSALSPIWASPERRSMAERADAASKLAGTMPFRSLMTQVMEFDPETVDRMEAERGADAFLQAALQAAQQPRQFGPGQRPGEQREMTYEQPDSEFGTQHRSDTASIHGHTRD